ncbi:MAG TPA: CBS domain-containing protein, partial [Candidatus Aminicenantes bacterium]|nr:CBS domain-containing protein [Candidatus Aminicenantes bacterium]
MSNKFKLSKYAELFQDIKASHIMTRDVIVLTPEKKISLAKELMRINKISGIPVVDQEKHLIGIISIEDIIVAVEFRRLGEPVRNMMTAEVIGLNEEDTLSDVVEKFETYKYGRFP